MAIERAQALDGRVVIEPRARLAGGVHDRARAEDEIRDERLAAAAQVGVDIALDRVDVVFGDELAALAAERRIIGEKDARLELDGPDLAVPGHYRKRRRGARHRRRRPVQVIPLAQTLVDYRGDVAREFVLELLRIERVDIAGGKVQHLGRIRGFRDTGGRAEQRE
jgi:hypothetical protein